MNPPSGQPTIMNQGQFDFIKQQLSLRLNSKTFKFINEHYPTQLFYQLTNRGIVVVPFELSSTIMDERTNTTLGNGKLYIEVYLINDNMNSDWHLNITNIKLISLDNSIFKPDKLQGTSVYKYNEIKPTREVEHSSQSKLANTLQSKVEQFTNTNEFENCFMKQNDIDDLIPDHIDFAGTETSCYSTESSMN